MLVCIYIYTRGGSVQYFLTIRERQHDAAQTNNTCCFNDSRCRVTVKLTRHVSSTAHGILSDSSVLDHIIIISGIIVSRVQTIIRYYDDDHVILLLPTCKLINVVTT